MQKLFIVFLSCIVILSSAYAAKKSAPKLPPLNAISDYIIDGDTFSALVKLENEVEIHVRVRIMQIDAPEMKGECESEIKAAHASKDRLAELIPPGTSIILSQIKDDKYLGRIDAFVAARDGKDIGEIMVKEGHARRYDGGKRQPWCK
jgi:endonuclease YncB( thermonuclease family)